MYPDGFKVLSVKNDAITLTWNEMNPSDFLYTQCTSYEMIVYYANKLWLRRSMSGNNWTTFMYEAANQCLHALEFSVAATNKAGVGVHSPPLRLDSLVSG